jgi:predicted transcriptional regulator
MYYHTPPGVEMIKKSETKTSGRPHVPPGDELVRLPIQLTRTQAARLKALADGRRTNISELIRAAVDSFLDAEPSGRAKKTGRAAGDAGKPFLTHEDLEELLKNR